MDITLLRETVGDNKDLMARTMGLFINTVPELLGNIKNAIEENDNKALRFNAHSLKGSLSYFTKDAPYTTTYEVEQAAVQGIESFGGDLKGLVERLNAEIEKLIEEMKQFLSDQV